MTAKTKLAFDATIKDVKVKVAKKDQYGSGSKAEADVTFTIRYPEPPKPPSIPHPFGEYNYQSHQQDTWKDLPKPPAKKKGMTDEEYEALDAVVEYRQLETNYRNAQEVYASEMDVYRRRRERHADRVKSYAMLIGIASVFGDQLLNVVVTPANQEMLPGFQLTMPGEDDEPPLLDYPTDVTPEVEQPAA